MGCLPIGQLVRDFCRRTIPFIGDVNLFQLFCVRNAFSPMAIPTRGRTLWGRREFETALSQIHGWLTVAKENLAREWASVANRVGGH